MWCFLSDLSKSGPNITDILWELEKLLQNMQIVVDL